jgi:DtxR family Mn-dependent transcriptional regulator
MAIGSLPMPATYPTSEAEEMYIITVARAIEDGVGPPVPVSTIAEVLEVSSVSANQMVKKLESVGLVSYAPYKGVTLTDTGDELANTVLRNRRLWGRFLADHLGLTPAKADEVACEMEHVTPSMVADRLASFLGDPTTGPTGKPIPGGPPSKPPRAMALSDIVVGEVVTLGNAPVGHVEFLRSQGIDDGAEISVIGSGSDGSMLVRGPNGTVHLAADIAGTIEVVRAS